MTQSIYNSASAARGRNSQRIKEFEAKKEEYLRKVVNYYKEKMLIIFEDNIYLTKTQFKEKEQEVRAETETMLRSEYDFKNQSANENFALKVNHKLNELKKTFKQKNLDNCKVIANQTTNVVSKTIKSYGKKMRERYSLIQTIENLDESHQLVLGKVSNRMQNDFPFKDTDFLQPYVETFERETNKLYDTYKTQLNQRIQNHRQKYLTAVEIAKSLYIEVKQLIHIF